MNPITLASKISIILHHRQGEFVGERKMSHESAQRGSRLFDRLLDKEGEILSEGSLLFIAATAWINANQPEQIAYLTEDTLQWIYIPWDEWWMKAVRP